MWDNGELLQEGLCHTQVCCTQSPCPSSRSLLTHTSTWNIQTQLCLSLYGVSESWCAQGLLEPSERLWGLWGLILNVFCPSYHLAGASPLPLDVGCLFLVRSNILLLTVVQEWAVILAHPSTPSSWNSHQLYCNLKTLHVATSTILKLKNYLCGKTHLR